MDDLLHYLCLEILGNFLFCFGRNVLKIVTFGTIRLENPTRFQMFIVAILGLTVSFSFLILLLSLS